MQLTLHVAPSVFVRKLFTLLYGVGATGPERGKIRKARGSGRDDFKRAVRSQKNPALAIEVSARTKSRATHHPHQPLVLSLIPETFRASSCGCVDWAAGSVGF